MGTIHRTYDDHEDHLRVGNVTPVFLKGGERDKNDVVARLAEDRAEVVHHSYDLKRPPADPDLLAERFFVWEQGLDDILSNDGDIGAFLHIEICQKAPAPHILRMDVLIVTRGADEDGRVGLLFAKADSLGDGPLNRRDAQNVVHLGTHCLGVLYRKVGPHPLLLRGIAAKGRVEL